MEKMGHSNSDGQNLYGYIKQHVKKRVVASGRAMLDTAVPV